MEAAGGPGQRSTTDVTRGAEQEQEQEQKRDQQLHKIESEADVQPGMAGQTGQNSQENGINMKLD